MRHSRAMGRGMANRSKNILRRAVFPGWFAVLAACGDGAPRSAAPPPDIPPAEIGTSTPRFADGPIANACLQQDRRGASQARCGCVQAAADLTMSQSVQQRSVRFFNEPELLQAMKLSDTPENERYWAIWASFAETAEQLCKDI